MVPRRFFYYHFLGVSCLQLFAFLTLSAVFSALLNLPTQAKHICLDSPSTRSVLTVLRNTKTSRTEFRKATKMVASFLLHEVMKHFDMPSFTVTTPCGIARGTKISNGIVCIPILRAGLSLMSEFLEYFPEARVGMIGLRRDEENSQSTLLLL